MKRPRKKTKTKKAAPVRSPSSSQGKRQKYTCEVGGCGFKVWGKFGAAVLCGHHETPIRMMPSD